MLSVRNTKIPARPRPPQLRPCDTGLVLGFEAEFLELSEAFHESQNGHHEKVKEFFMRTSKLISIYLHVASEFFILSSLDYHSHTLLAVMVSMTLLTL